MNEKPILQTTEAVAYQLMLLVLQAEKNHRGDGTFSISTNPSSLYIGKEITGKEIFDTYQQCIKAITSK